MPYTTCIGWTLAEQSGGGECRMVTMKILQATLYTKHFVLLASVLGIDKLSYNFTRTYFINIEQTKCLPLKLL